MNRVISRAKALFLLILILAGGMAFFLGEYFAKSQNWILFNGSPHVYNASNIGCGMITDRNGMLILDLSKGRTYSALEQLRRATLHWVGDRQGNISAPALSYYAEEIAGFDPINGIYNYSGNGGQVKLTLSGNIQMTALEAMGDYKGTLAVYNYRTGELLCAISTPNFDMNSPLEVFEQIYQHERSITSAIDAVANMTEGECDLATRNFIDWYLNEQIEEEAAVLRIISKLKTFGSEKSALYLIDKELSQREYESPSY